MRNSKFLKLFMKVFYIFMVILIKCSAGPDPYTDCVNACKDERDASYDRIQSKVPLDTDALAEADAVYQSCRDACDVLE